MIKFSRAIPRRPRRTAVRRRRTRRLSGTANHAHRPVGAREVAPTPRPASSERCWRRSWDNRSTSSTASAAAASGTQRDRAGGARRLHDRHHHGRDRDDALARAHRSFGRLVHADRARQRGSGRASRSPADSPYKSRQRAGRGDQGEPGQVQGVGHGAGRHLASRDCGYAAGPEGRPCERAVGAVAAAPRPGSSTSSPAACRSPPCSLPEARAMIDAGKVKSLAVMADKPAALYPNVPTLKAATGSNWTMAAWRGIAAPKSIPPEARDKLVAAIAEDRRQQGLHRVHGASRATA